MRKPLHSLCIINRSNPWTQSADTTERLFDQRFARLKVVLVKNRLGHGIRRAVIPAGITGMSVKANPDHRSDASVRAAPPFAAAHEFHAERKFLIFHGYTSGRGEDLHPP